MMSVKISKDLKFSLKEKKKEGRRHKHSFTRWSVIQIGEWGGD